MSVKCQRTHVRAARHPCERRRRQSDELRNVRRGQPAARARGDDLRGGDDVHRPDDRHPRRLRPAEGPLAVRDGDAVDRQRLSALARRAVHAGRQAADVLGHRRILIVGVTGFAAASALAVRRRPAASERRGSSASASSRAHSRRSCSRPRWRSSSAPFRCTSAVARSPRSSASPAPALRPARLRGRQRRPAPDVRRVRAVLLLRQRLRAGVAGLLGHRGRRPPARVLRRLRHRARNWAAGSPTSAARGPSS